MLKRAYPILIVCLLVAAGWWWGARMDAPPPSQATVSRVVDGDTVYVRAGSRSFDVRLLGIDTPETVDPHRPVGCYGPEASAYTKHLLTGQRVRLVYDRERRDRYGRWLAYIYLEREGRPDLFVNARLVSAGYARTLSIPPNTAHATELAGLERSAALAGRGLWSSCG
ncbi:MAG: micrococcal nuclease [Gaiellales bacterium]|jgi:micrococcal nuclease|nr:micrococcal nuclease [Gaiellales bacterium]MDX6551010.1 micrococcal nuclease [Gaiellales bacterium]